MNKDPPNNSNINSNQTLATVLFDLIKAAAMTTATPISALISAAASNQTAMTATTNTTTLTTTTNLNSSSNKSIYNETYLNSSISSSSSLIGLLSSSLSSAREQIIDSSLMSTATSSVASSTASASAQPQLNIDVPLSTIYISMIAYAFIFAIGFFGNALVILVAYCSRRAQQNSTHYCLVNLSVADLLLIIVCMPSAVLDLFSKEVWYLGYFLCKIIPWLEHTVAQASILTIVSISIERSLAIASPLRAKRFFTSELLWLVVVLIWIISTISSIPIMVSTKYIQGLFHKKLATNVTVCVVDAGKKWTLVYLYISLFLFYLLPCFSLFALYGNIVLIIKRRSNKAGNGNGGSGGTYNGTSATAAAALLAAHRHSKYSMTNHTNKNGGNGGGKQQQIYMEDLEDDEEIEKTGSLAVPASRNSSGKSFGKHWSSRRNDEHRRDLTTLKKVANQAASILLPQINQKQIILLLIVMMMTIFICLLPYRVFSLWMAQASKQQLEKLGLVKYYNIITFCRLAFYTNSALNPIFYHIISTKFRAAFKRYFRFSFNVSLNSVAQRANGGNGGQAGGGGNGGQAAAHERPAITPVAVATAGQSRKYIHQPCRSMTKDESALINATKI